MRVTFKPADRSSRNLTYKKYTDNYMHTLYLQGLPTSIPPALRVDEASYVYTVQR